MLLGIIPWLVLAASIEGFVSPFHYLSYGAKLSLGIIVAAAFWMWTLWPERAE